MWIFMFFSKLLIYNVSLNRDCRTVIALLPPQARTKKGQAENRCPLGGLEAAPGLEPGNNGFADRCLSHLAMPPFG
jgi:hypothetical protein